MLVKLQILKKQVVSCDIHFPIYKYFKCRIGKETIEQWTKHFGPEMEEVLERTTNRDKVCWKFWTEIHSQLKLPACPEYYFPPKKGNYRVSNHAEFYTAKKQLNDHLKDI